MKEINEIVTKDFSNAGNKIDNTELSGNEQILPQAKEEQELSVGLHSDDIKNYADKARLRDSMIANKDALVEMWDKAKDKMNEAVKSLHKVDKSLSDTWDVTKDKAGEALNNLREKTRNADHNIHSVWDKEDDTSDEKKKKGLKKRKQISLLPLHEETKKLNWIYTKLSLAYKIILENIVRPSILKKH